MCPCRHAVKRLHCLRVLSLLTNTVCGVDGSHGYRHYALLSAIVVAPALTYSVYDMNCIVDCHVGMGDQSVSESAEATRSILHDGFLCVCERERGCVCERDIVRERVCV